MAAAEPASDTARSGSAGLKVTDSCTQAASVSRDILILTSLMTGRRHGPSSKSPDEAQLALWSRLAFVLNTGHPNSDPTGDRVVAVTGYVDNEGIKSSVVTRNSQVRDGRVPKPTVLSKKIEDLLGWKDIPDNFTFEQHVEDVRVVLQHCIDTGTTVPRQVIVANDVFIFIVRRCYPKIYARINNGRRIWGDHPIRIIAEWYRSAIPPSTLASKRFDVPPSDILSRHGLQPCTDNPNSSYEVSVHNAKDWCDVLDECLSTLEDVFKAKRRVPDYPASLQKAYTALDVMEVLHALLKSGGVVDHLITSELADDLQLKYNAKMSTPSGEESTTTATSGSAGDDDGDGDVGETEDIADSRQADGETSKQHVLRYLQNVIIPYTSACSMATLHTRVGNASFQMELVSMVPVSPEVTEAVVVALKDKIFNVLQEKELEESKRDEMKVAIDKMFTQFTPDKLNSINDGATVHAEAALMGVAYAIANQERKADGTEWHIDGLPRATATVHIGVSKKCCYCCARLSSLLRVWRDWNGDVKKHPVFVLPGTHAGIFPWVPPPCGIPAEVLEGMRKGLLEILFEIACGGLSRSNQSSPALTHLCDEAEGVTGSDVHVSTSQLSTKHRSLSYRIVQGLEITEEILEAASDLFSSSYGVWTDTVIPPLEPGARVKLSAKKLKDQGVADADSVLAMCHADNTLVGHAFARVWKYDDIHYICWVTQLVVSSDCREKGIASTLLRMLPGPGFACAAIGLVSTHPAACLALAKSANVKITQLNLAYIEAHAQEILRTAPVKYLQGAQLHGSLFGDSSAGRGVVSTLDTAFYVDHGEPLEALRRWKEEHSVEWPLGELPEGHEFFVVVPILV
ncbi:hypothetical protein C8Q74DRAFT_1434810 [Fomes fomentarius]|nr:hypothetical protein C8Q74DRAFT_1434810 [Fomes fomentarius]